MLLLFLSTYVLQAQDFAPEGKKQWPEGKRLCPEGKRLWKISLFSLSAANAFDMHSSWGKRELNPALSDGAGRFGAKGALIKVGLQSAVMGLEYLVTRRHPSRKTYRALSMLNFGASAGMGMMAVRNYGIR